MKTRYLFEFRTPDDAQYVIGHANVTLGEQIHIPWATRIVELYCGRDAAAGVIARCSPMPVPNGPLAQKHWTPIEVLTRKLRPFEVSPGCSFHGEVLVNLHRVVRVSELAQYAKMAGRHFSIGEQE